MKRTILVLSAAISLMIFSSLAIAQERVGIIDALNKGLISITVRSLAKGEMVELKITRLTSNPVIVVVKKGRTDIAGEVSILSDREKEINLSKKNDDVITFPQVGADRYTGGPKTLEHGTGK